MSAIPYVPADLHQPAAIVEAIRARRGGRLLNLDRILLHSPNFARGWNTLLGATRSELILPADLRELCICAVGALNGAEYELQQHSPPFLAAGGTALQLQALRDIEGAIGNAQLFSALERGALRLCLAMSRAVQVPPALISELRAALGSDPLLVELVGVIATYNMVSRFLVALEVDLE